jgi:hexosaminidase
VQLPVEPVVGEISIIPRPSSVKRIGGQFELSSETKIFVADQPGIQASAVLNELLLLTYGITLNTTGQDDHPNSIKLSGAAPADGLAEEAYFLRVQPGSIQITGSDRGLFYGVQTLRQMLPAGFDGKAMIPAAEILDTPRFPYRGMHLDVARHFMQVDTVKKFISLISRYKYNYFHWHLTDDQGWRIEIRKYPRLTEIGSKRRESMVGKDPVPYVGDRTPVEGFYTQEQIRKIVAFARAKQVTIIPEIDMPGHSAAAIASYPDLGCRARYPASVPTTWPASTNILCPKEETFQFIDGVIAEVAELFPGSPYIHIGGDEVKTDQWRESPFVAALMRQQNLRSDTGLRSWFMKRVAGIVNSHGKKVIGWDEITEGVPPPDATVMSWRGSEGGIAAARAGLPVIMSPFKFTYFDRLQGDAAFEPLTIPPVVPLENVYSFEPVPARLTEAESRYVIGAQGCLWTEFIKKPEDLEYMAFPRALALAEVLWSSRQDRNYADFTKRLFNELPRFDRENINYRMPAPLGFRDRILLGDEDAVVDLKFPVRDARIYYTTDGTKPHAGSNLYEQPFVLPLARDQEIILKVKIIAGNNRESAVFAARYVRKLKAPVRSD